MRRLILSFVVSLTLAVRGNLRGLSRLRVGRCQRWALRRLVERGGRPPLSGRGQGCLGWLSYVTLRQRVRQQQHRGTEGRGDAVLCPRGALPLPPQQHRPVRAARRPRHARQHHGTRQRLWSQRRS